MIQKIISYIKEKESLVSIIMIAIIAVIIITVAMSPIAQSNLEKQKENEYFLKLKDSIKEFNEKIPTLEDKLRTIKLQNRCYNSQMDRIKSNEKYEIGFCEKKENLEKFSNKNKEESQPVAFSFIKNDAKKGASNSQLSQKVKILHKDWAKNDEKQKTLNKLYKISNGDLDFVGTVLGENGNLNPTLKSYVVGANGYRDIGVCQINIGYHPEIVNNPKFKDIDFQVKKCRELYKGGTVFYGKKHKDKMITKLIINKM